MSDDFENKNYFDVNNTFQSENNDTEKETANKDGSSYSQSSQDSSANESSYEWNADKSGSNSANEYHYSYVNGNNENAEHNPNNYENAYSSAPSQNAYENSYSANNNTSYSGTSQYGASSQNSSYGSYSQQNAYGNYSQPPYANSQYGSPAPPMGTQNIKKKKVKKQSKPVTRGFLTAIIAITVIASGALGFGGGYIANSLKPSSGSSLNINKVASDNTSNTSSSNAGTTSTIVKKTADSVVEIATESVVTGSFARQYIQQGAGSGVIISDDGYIITNYHVIEGANSVTVTLRDGKTNYTAAVIGSDSDNDIALLKIDAEKLSPATFGDSSTLAVGDYVVAIGNPLGELGGTVTDGIISALAREVAIENKNMTLLQTNAQISPGNSGGGLFNSKGELVGIVNAKDSATEVEGIGFAIPINNVLDIINDLKSYGYVTGKIDLGMELTDITSNESAFYYGVNKTGCYILSVTRGSNAESAGFRTGDIVTKVNDTNISTSADVKKALKDAKVGDTAEFTVYRSGKSVSISLKLEEYVPSGGKNSAQPATTPTNSDDSIWSQMFDW